MYKIDQTPLLLLSSLRTCTRGGRGELTDVKVRTSAPERNGKWRRVKGFEWPAVIKKGNPHQDLQPLNQR